MDAHASACSLTLFLLLIATWISRTAAWLSVPFSSNYYGPDGPWQAVSINISGYVQENTANALIQEVDMYPVFDYPGTYVLSGNLCHKQDSLCGKGGLWDAGTGRNYADNPLLDWENFTTTWPGVGGNFTGILNQQNLSWISDDKSATMIPNAYVFLVDNSTNTNVTLPSGNVLSPEVGMFSFGTDQKTQNIHRVMVEQTSTYLAQDGQIASNSFGIHIGSTRYNYPGSLILGGYDQGRVIGPVTSWSADYPSIDLLDLLLGVEVGNQPWDTFSQSGILSPNNGSSLPVTMTLGSPYLAFPRAVCDNFLSRLPIQYNDQIGYYLWDTNDRRYWEMANSSAYLGFVFNPAQGQDDDVTIKVPLQLLVLNLTEAITGYPSPAPYFPCVPMEQPWEGSWLLGRAFMQAAFLGHNWDSKTFWLGQAPGPGSRGDGLGISILDLTPGATNLTLMNGENLFADSWKTIWGDLTPVTTTTGGGLSTADKAGIGVGAGVGTIVILAVIWYLLRRQSLRKKRENTAASSETRSDEVTAAKKELSEHNESGFSPVSPDMKSDNASVELEAFNKHELDATKVYELRAERSREASQHSKDRA